eukprot:2982368-Rhodomonas_salina.1
MTLRSRDRLSLFARTRRELAWDSESGGPGPVEAAEGRRGVEDLNLPEGSLRTEGCREAHCDSDSSL